MLSNKGKKPLVSSELCVLEQHKTKIFDNGKLLGARSLLRDLKKQLYTTLIRSVVTYGAETWAIRKTDENRLLSFERKILRRIFGPVKDSVTNEWRIRKNEELESLYQKPNIVEAIRTKRLQWAGHAWRNKNPLIRTVLEKNPAGERPIGRPKMR
ncbi:Uncharacterized protein FWK35_00007901 [Aphis craccivora]|uniref:Reverse transcriptase domain-containing protein n=1 Tax=Aphis craccivora TaxID=307492 RepID=A0A6G0ZLI7_APHCR|nr:Uncharacterized protein FWK35_00007901 [Aphis craccivora]